MSNSNDLCELCGEGRLHTKTLKNAVEYHGKNGVVDLHFSVCDVCGSEQSSASQLCDNKHAMIQILAI